MNRYVARRTRAADYLSGSGGDLSNPAGDATVHRLATFVAAHGERFVSQPVSLSLAPSPASSRCSDSNSTGFVR